MIRMTLTAAAVCGCAIVLGCAVALVAGFVHEMSVVEEYRYVARIEESRAEMCREDAAKGRPIPLPGHWVGLRHWTVVHYSHEPWFEMRRRKGDYERWSE